MNIVTSLALTVWAAVGLSFWYMDFETNPSYPNKNKKQMVFRHIGYGPVAWVAMVVIYACRTFYNFLGK